jgi:hypothetical protein
VRFESCQPHCEGANSIGNVNTPLVARAVLTVTVATTSAGFLSDHAMLSATKVIGWYPLSRKAFVKLSRVAALSGVAPSTRLSLVVPGTLGSARRPSTSVRASGGGRGAAGGTLAGLDGADTDWAPDGSEDDGLDRCDEHPETTNTAVATTAQRALQALLALAGNQGYGSIQPAEECGAPDEPTGATEVTLATAPATTATADTRVVRGFIGTGVLSLGRI